MKDKPVFKPQIPGDLLENLSKRDRYLYEQLSIQHQQNEWIIDRLQVGESRFKELESKQVETDSKVAGLEKFKTVLTAKWTVGVALFSMIAFPIVLAFLGAAFVRWFERSWK